MGLLDQVLGGGGDGRSAGGLDAASPVVKSVLLLLATRMQGGQGAAPAGGLGGMLGGLLGGGGAQAGGPLGGMLGSVLGGGNQGGLGAMLGSLGGAGGLAALVEQFNRGGHGETISSWIGTGQNVAIAPQGLADVLGAENVNALSQHTGLSQSDLLGQLSQILPGALDKLTPNGRLPTDDELGRG